VKRAITFLTFFTSCATGITMAQDSVRTAVNTGYNEAGKGKRWWLGKHYRKDWATEVNFPVLNLDTAAGGLTAIKLGGGMQTKSLRLQGADGKEYVLRTVNKDPSKTLPAELVGTFADDIVQDQISSANPYAPLVVAALAETAGILHIKPQMVYVPKSKRLGEFEKEFAGTVCLFEERPDVTNSEKLFQKLANNPNHRVDQRAFLKARLFDMWIGDWDRHQDQWLWAPVKKGDLTLYQPIPRDRDQAFPSLDGVIPQLAARKWAVRKTQNFDYTIRDINGLNMSGNYLDRNFTTQLTLAEWLTIAHQLQLRLTDTAIATAVSKLPADIYALSGEEIIKKLKRRRDDLYKYAAAYYSFVNEETDITGTRENDIFTVTRINSDSTMVTVTSGSKLIYRRVFLREETKEIRLYGFGGDDQFQIDEQKGKGILVRVIKDEGEALRKASHYDWLAPRIAPGFNPDDGVYFGGGIIFKKQQFGKAPFGYMQSIWGNYAFATGAYNFWYQGIFREAVGKWDLHIDATINAPHFVRNYYGMGNETVKSNEDRDYYRVRTNQLIITPSLHRHYGKNHSLQFGISGQSMKVEATVDRFITETHVKSDSSIFERKYYFNSFAAYTFSTIDNPLYPRKGIRIKGRADYTINPDEQKSFVRLSYESSAFLSAGSFTFAFRNGINTNLSDEYEFFQANTIGGMETVRGYRRDRFSGKTRVFNNTEVRFRLSQAKGYILRGDYGLFTFFDNGRVWVRGEDSKTWHHGYGGGFWFLAYNRLPFTIAYSASDEGGMVTMKAGFLF
jgi:hemolysin activation/secretion protein